MSKSERIVRASAEEIREKLAREGSKTDWRKARSHSPAAVERLADEQDGPLPEGWENSIDLGLPEPKQGVHIRLDAHVLRWFRQHGPGYQSRINAVLRAFVAARSRTTPEKRKSKA
jgi:uncharacterized protein (DUF4415 family)